MKRLVTVGLVLSLLLVGAPSLAAPLSGTFTDDDGNLHEPNIQAIAAAGITLGCGGSNYCPDSTVRRDEMASFLARALELPTRDGGPFTDIGGNMHAGAINAIAAAGITLGCAADRYCPAAPVRRDEMASFLARALDLEPVYVLLGMAAGLPLSCSKDGMTCSGSFSVPRRPAYRVAEGFYQVVPSTPAEQGEFASASTRFELHVNGAARPLEAVTVEGEGVTEKRFEGAISLEPGGHQLVGRWYWNGSLVQTTTLTITVRG